MQPFLTAFKNYLCQLLYHFHYLSLTTQPMTE